MSLKEDLIAVRAAIDVPEKWCKRPGWTYHNGQTARCAWAATIDVLTGPRMLAAREALLHRLPWWWRVRFIGSDLLKEAQLIRFNDRPETTHADVMALFARAIAAAGDTP